MAQKIQITLDGGSLTARHFATAMFRAGLPCVVHEDVYIPDELLARLVGDITALAALNAERLEELAMDAAAQHRVSTGTNRKRVTGELRS